MAGGPIGDWTTRLREEPLVTALSDQALDQLLVRHPQALYRFPVRAVIEGH